MNNDEFCARWILDQDQENDFRVFDYGCGSGEIVEQLKKSNVEAFGCELFYEGGRYSKSVPPQLWGALSVRGWTGCLVPLEIGCPDRRVGSSNGRCRLSGSNLPLGR